MAQRIELRCPCCGAHTKIVYVKSHGDKKYGEGVIRYRACKVCGERYVTKEVGNGEFIVSVYTAREYQYDREHYMRKCDAAEVKREMVFAGYTQDDCFKVTRAMFSITADWMKKLIKDYHIKNINIIGFADTILNRIDND